MSISSIKKNGKSKCQFLSIIFLFLFIPSQVLPKTEIPVSTSSGVKIYRTVTNWKELRDKDVVKQKFDYSCGSSALATLINLCFPDKVTEEEIIQLILDSKDSFEIQEIAQYGYSLLDLARAAETKGYTAFMYNVKLHHLYQLKGPVLVYFEPYEEKHFAVLKQVTKRYVYLADPARGNIRVPIYLFLSEWHGVILAIDK
jgi:predicted double-glycine peptidase